MKFRLESGTLTNISTGTKEEEKEYISLFLLRGVLEMFKTTNLDKDWRSLLEQEQEKTYMKKLYSFLLEEQKSGKTVYPPFDKVFNSLELTPLNLVKVVIVGQDPYHGLDQAHGLSFSVAKGVRRPPSLKNILAEVESDIGKVEQEHGNLEGWAEQGVLLLNSILTVRDGEPSSHKKRGWELFTDALLAKVSSNDKPVVFMLWGRYAQDKGFLVDRNKNLVLSCAHPSPFSVKKFKGCKHFSQANKYLINNELTPIKWNVL